MKWLLSAPSKTFLLGEYVALQSGPALIIASAPRFELSVEYTAKTQPVIYTGIHTESPAGQLLQAHAAEFTGCDLQFNDPHNGAGGFGASSAQFLLIAALRAFLKTRNSSLTWTVETLLAHYLTYAWQGVGIPPSGADLIAQVQGGLSYFYRQQRQLQKLAWPFPDINYYLLRTGHKIATHQHLQELTVRDTANLHALVLAGLQQLAQTDATGFISTINAFAEQLQTLDLVLPATQKLLQRLKACSAVLAAKGCGALGADVVLVLVSAEQHTAFMAWLHAEPALQLMLCSNTVVPGLQITTELDLTI